MPRKRTFKGIPDPAPLRAYKGIGQRFREMSPAVDWESIRTLTVELQKAYSSLMEPSNVALLANQITVDEKFETARAWYSEVGELARAAINLNWAISDEFLRKRFAPGLQAGDYTLEELEAKLGPPLSNGAIGQRIVEAFAASQLKLSEAVDLKHKPIERLAKALAARFRDEGVQVLLRGLPVAAAGVGSRVRPMPGPDGPPCTSLWCDKSSLPAPENRRLEPDLALSRLHWTP